MCVGRVCTGVGATGSFSPDIEYVPQRTAFSTVQRDEREMLKTSRKISQTDQNAGF